MKIKKTALKRWALYQFSFLIFITSKNNFCGYSRTSHIPQPKILIKKQLYTYSIKRYSCFFKKAKNYFTSVNVIFTPWNWVKPSPGAGLTPIEKMTLFLYSIKTRRNSTKIVEFRARFATSFFHNFRSIDFATFPLCGVAPHTLPSWCQLDRSHTCRISRRTDQKKRAVLVPYRVLRSC